MRVLKIRKDILAAQESSGKVLTFYLTCGIGICLCGSTKSGFGGKSRSKNINFCLSETPSNLYFGSCSNLRFSSSESSGFGIRRDVTSISPKIIKKYKI